MSDRKCLCCGGTVTLRGKPLEGMYCSPRCLVAHRAGERYVAHAGDPELQLERDKLVLEKIREKRAQLHSIMHPELPKAGA